MSIHPLSVIDPQAEIHPDAVVGPFCVVQGPVVLEAGVELKNHATVYGRARIGEGSIIFPHTVIGSDPQDLKFRGEDSQVIIGKRSRLHEYVTVSKGTAGGGMKTVIGDDCLIMSGVHIAHDCILHNQVVIGNNTQLAGHIEVGRKAIVCGMVGLHQFVTLGEFSFVGAMSGVRTDVPPYVIVEGYPAETRTVNVVGLRRDGFDDATIRAVKDAFRMLFHDRSSTKAEALARLRRETVLPADSPVHRLCDWVERQLEVSVKGRVQEAFRQNGKLATPLPHDHDAAVGSTQR